MKKNAPTGADSQVFDATGLLRFQLWKLAQPTSRASCGGLQLIRFIVVGANQDKLQQTHSLFLGIEA